MHNVVSNVMHLGSPLSVLSVLAVSRQIKDARQTVTEFDSNTLLLHSRIVTNFYNLAFDI